MRAKDRFRLPARRLAIVLLAGLLLGQAARAQTASQGRLLVEDVIVYGNRLVPTPRITGLLRTRAGQEYSQDSLNEDVRKLYETRLFGNVQTQVERTPGGGVKVWIGVVEYPNRVQEVVYQGAKHLKPEELETITWIRRDTPLNPKSNRLACQAIVNRYRELGRPFASCELLEGDDDTDTRVVFNITEGPVVRVKDIAFEGHSFVSGPVLRTHIASSRSFLGLGGKYNPLMVDADVHKLEEYYRTHGFLNVRVSRELRYHLDPSWVTIVFHIHEGPRYRVEGTTLVGSKAFSNEELLRLSKLEVGGSYNQDIVNADKRRIEDYIGFSGRSANVRERLVFAENDPGVVRVQYEVLERPPARVGQIIIIGNEVTRENVIRRQIPLYPGQVLSFPDLRVAEANLARLGIFEVNPEAGIRPTVTLIDPDCESPFKDIIVNVQEARTGSLIFGLGVNSDAGLTGSVVLNERNFDLFRPPTSFEDLLSGRAWRGAGQEFRLEAVPGTRVQRYSVQFREPFLFDTPYSLEVGAYFRQWQFDEYDEGRLGFRATLGRRLNRYWSASAGIRVENVDISQVLFFAPPDIQDVRGDNFLLGLRAGLVRDTRDSYLRPTEGNRLEFAFEQVLGDFTYPVLNLEANQYFTVYQRADGSGRHVLALRSQVAWAGEDIPVFERFYAGGFRTLRGFEFRGVSPEVNGFKVGGDFMFLNSIEYQVPLTANDQVLAVAFLDSGTVEPDASINNYRVTAGFGFRFTVPMMGPVPIALDFGFPINTAPGDREQIFSFWLGFFR